MTVALPWQAIEIAKNHLFGYPTDVRLAGERLFASEAVEFIDLTEALKYYGLVHNFQPYEVELIFEDGLWKEYCTCPRGRRCRDTYAALRRFLQQESSGKRAEIRSFSARS